MKNTLHRLGVVAIALALATAGSTPAAAGRITLGAPHYYEDADGWLQAPGDNPNLDTQETRGFPVRRQELPEKRPPTALALFAKTGGVAGKLMLGIQMVPGHKDSPCKVKVLWDGREAADLDATDHFKKTTAPFSTTVEIPGPQNTGVHELRIVAGEAAYVLVKNITLTGDGELAWVEKPALPDGGSLEVLSAYYMPDPPPPPDSQAVEGRHPRQDVGLLFKQMQNLYKEHAEFGAVRVVVRNNGKVPVRISNTLLLNGKPVEQSYVDFVNSKWDAPGVVWYRVRPRLLRSEQCAQVYIRFRRRPKGEQAAVTINLENGEPVEVNIPYQELPLTIDYVTTDRGMDTLYVYARHSPGAKPGKVTQLTLDGKVVENATIYGADFPGNVALAVAKPGRLKAGRYHVVGVKTDTGAEVHAQFRALEFIFPRSSFHISPQACPDLHMNTAMWYWRPLDICEKYDTYNATMGINRVHARRLWTLGVDEPDAHDARSKVGEVATRYAQGLGYHARRLAHNGWQELIERFVPHSATWLIMNGTTRPLNWMVYGQFADICCFDPYPVAYYGADHTYVWESLSFSRLCGAPNRMYACLEAFGWRSSSRAPVPQEYRQNVVQAIGTGMKGLTSWVALTNAGDGFTHPYPYKSKDKPFKKEVTKLNMLLEHIDDDLLLGTPIDLVASDAGLVPTGRYDDQRRWKKDRVWVGSLLCGPDTIVVAAANHIPPSKPEPPWIQPAKDVTITVQLPDFLQSVRAFEATEDGVADFPCTIADGKALLKLDSIETGRVFLLRRK